MIKISNFKFQISNTSTEKLKRLEIGNYWKLVIIGNSINWRSIYG